MADILDPLPWVADDVDVPWSALTPMIANFPISIGWIDCLGNYWPLTGINGGSLGAFITGDIDGLVHVPFEGLWTQPAYGQPRYERQVDARKEVAFQLGLYSDTSLGWYDVESRWWAGCRSDATGFLSVTTYKHGQLWIPMQLLEAPKCKLDDDAARQRFAVHNVVLACDGEPRFRRPDKQPLPFTATTGTNGTSGYITVANLSLRPQWPYYICEAPANITLPDGPSVIVGDAYTYNLLSDWPDLLNTFGDPVVDTDAGTLTWKRTPNTVTVPALIAGNNALIDSDPSHRIAVSALDPVDNSMKQDIRNSTILSMLFGSYGQSGLPLIQQWSGAQGFVTPIPPRCVATLPVSTSTIGNRIWLYLPQLWDSALA
jgi:hypothetical protein